MTLCAVVSWVLEGSNRILPQDPGSIAAKTSLFANVRTEWTRVVNEAVEHVKRDGGSWKDEGHFEGWEFKLGW